MNELYKKRLSVEGRTVGMSRKKVSDMIINHTWNNDIQSKKCYIYDFFHDTEHDLYSDLKPNLSPLKCEVDAKFIVTQYASLSKDQVEYHILFRPGFTNPLDYFQKEYSEKYKSEFPIGMYIDIPNDEGVYYRWMICSKELGNQFVKYLVLPCNYRFQWIFDHKKYEMWGIARLRNSYNSGLWTDYKTTSVENQDSMWLPLNKYSENIYYNQRFIISHPIYNPSKDIFPITWEVSKVEGLHPFGIQKVVIYQDIFNKNTDYVELDENNNIIGMWADYYDSQITPETIMPEPEVGNHSVITCHGVNAELKIGGSYKKLSCNFYNNWGDEITDITGVWIFTVDDVDVSSHITILNTDVENVIKIKFDNDQNFIGKVLIVHVSDDAGEYSSTLQLALVSL